MAYKIESKPLANIVTVTYSGSASLDMRLQAVAEVCNNYSDLKPFKILVDVRDLVMDLLFGEQEAFGEYLANHYDLHNARVAVLHKPSFNPNAVIDAKAYSNGYQLAQFSDRRDAELWLLKKDQD
ncbi:MAG: hypothetical protein O6932_04815 [Gammaproteobacteria bacterium]|nr:hypothetical protein [Gammaproteobacteria bacterium]